MEEDGFDDNGWSRFFAPNAQSKADPPNAGRDLTQEHSTCATEDKRGTECLLKAEDDGNEIDFSMSIPEQQRTTVDLEGYDAPVDVERSEKNEDIPQDQTLLHDTRVTQDRCDKHYCKITPLAVDEVKHAVSATEWPPFDPSSCKQKDKDEHNTYDKAVDDEAKTKTESTPFEPLPLKDYKDKSSTKGAQETVDNQAKTTFERPPFGSLSLEKTDKDRKSTKEEGMVGDQAKVATESPLFETLSLKEKDKDKNNNKKEGEGAQSQMKAATYSSHVGFSIFEKASSIIFRNAFQSFLRWISSTSLEKKDKVKNKIRSCHGSLLYEWLQMEDEDNNITSEAVKTVGNWPKTNVELRHVRTGSPSSKSDESKSNEKRQTIESSAAKPEFRSTCRPTPVNLLNSWFPLFLSILISVFFQAAGGTLVIAPEDVIGMKGGIIRLRCSTQHQNTVYWERILVASNEQQTIYFGINGMVNIDGANDRFKIDSDPDTGRYDLVIKDLQLMDAATYICIGDNGIGEERRAQLVVLDNFSCDMPMPSNGFMGENTVNIPVDNIQASCSLQFRGHVTPRIEWRLDNIQINASHVNNGSTVKSVITMRGTKQLNGAKLSSLPTVSGAQDSANDAIPWWTSTPLKVNYIHLELGEVAECQGYRAIVPVCIPSCKYQQVEIPGDKLCDCVAVYNMDGVNYNITIRKQLCYGSDSSSKESSIIIAVCATVVGLLIAISIILIIIKKRRSTAKGSGTPPGSEDGLLPEQNTLVNNETPEEKLETSTKEKFVASTSQNKA